MKKKSTRDAQWRRDKDLTIKAKTTSVTIYKIHHGHVLSIQVNKPTYMAPNRTSKEKDETEH